ncbi:metallophosphoesterase family protein [Aliivibrio sifiae]|uniref:Calcineurin-like phosphoesterase domain-containing protein n=1 Tax=Aliivibrio sifiae TaxID=566293 RepID=A0A2S7X111_9GAMM|nr:metallophosphoesterase family protein [Aliivibrio sifiae]PQJ83341.1 hypothetical protein BTO22_18305 [Aliivibrio sifiae]
MIAIISDIHGNLPALNAVLNDIYLNKNVNKIISLGDVSGYAPFVNECIERLIDVNAINIMGNHDFYLLSGLGCPRSKSVNELSETFSNKITKNSIDFLKVSPLFFSENDVIMVHAGFQNPIDEYLYSISQSYFERFNYKYFFSGHTHVQHVEYFENGQVYCNPGSVGQPRDGDARASYALFSPDSGEITLKRVEYDVNSVINELIKFGFSDYYYNNLLKGSRIGGKIDKIKGS